MSITSGEGGFHPHPVQNGLLNQTGHQLYGPNFQSRSVQNIRLVSASV